MEVGDEHEGESRRDAPDADVDEGAEEQGGEITAKSLVKLDSIEDAKFIVAYIKELRRKLRYYRRRAAAAQETKKPPGARGVGKSTSDEVSAVQKCVSRLGQAIEADLEGRSVDE
eukprot:793653-Pleurochrysis_carterae.AAC.1